MSDCNHLKVFNQVAKDSILDIAIVTGEEPHILPFIKNPLLCKFLKVIGLISCHIDMGNKIRKNKDKQAIIVHGFSNGFLIFTYCFSLFTTKNVYVLTHHNIQQAFDNLPSRLMLKFYNSLNYKFILNETSMILKYLGFSDKEIDKHLFLLHPVVKTEPLNVSNSELSKQKKIGLIGKFRKGKKMEKTLQLLLNIQKKIDFELIIGTDDFSPFTKLDNNKIKLVNTCEKDDYYATLAECDIIILNYEKSKYFYRCSGVAADAIGTKTFVLCPNFPLMNNQISYPSKVGLLYENESDLETAIQQSLNLVSNNVILFENHYSERSIENIASDFAKQLETKINLVKSDYFLRGFN
jgi:hypothetical protein